MEEVVKYMIYVKQLMCASVFVKFQTLIRTFSSS